MYCLVKNKELSHTVENILEKRSVKFTNFISLLAF